MEEKISVIVPLYNVKKYLRRCVASIIAQTYRNLEIFLVDDGSTDGSGDICDELAQEDSRIIVIHKENGGQASARNMALDRATGDWITFLDSDDWIEPDMYRTLLRLAKETNSDIATCSIKKYLDNGECLSTREDTNEVCVLSQHDAIADLLHQEKIRFEVWNKLWKKETVADVRFKEDQLCEEVYFDHHAFLNATRFVYVDTAFHNYVVGRPGSTASTFKEKRLTVFREFGDFATALKERNENDLANIITCISTRFSVNFYVEAVGSNTSDRIKSLLVEEFRRNYPTAKKSGFLTKKESVLFAVFNISPNGFARLFAFKSFLKNQRS